MNPHDHDDARYPVRKTDEQWRDAFRAANYTEEAASRYLRKIREKIAQGLSLKGETSENEES